MPAKLIRNKPEAAETTAEERLTNAMPPPVEEEDVAESGNASLPAAGAQGAEAQAAGAQALEVVQQIPLREIRLSPTNPRKTIDPLEIHALAESIRIQGLMSPVLVRPLRSMVITTRDGQTTSIGPCSREKCVRTMEELGIHPDDIDRQEVNDDCGYELIAGERRYLAHENLDARGEIPQRVMDAAAAGASVGRSDYYDHIPALVRDLTDRQVLEQQITENQQREDLTADDWANVYTEMVAVEKQEKGETGAVQRVADRLGLSVSVVYQAMQVTKCIPEIREALSKGYITKNHAIDAARWDEAEQKEYLCEAFGCMATMLGVVLEEGPETVVSMAGMRRWLRGRHPKEQRPENQSLFGAESEVAAEESKAPSGFVELPSWMHEPKPAEVISEDTIAEAAGMRQGEEDDAGCFDVGLQGNPALHLSGLINFPEALEQRFLRAVEARSIQGVWSGTEICKVTAPNQTSLTFTRQGNGKFQLVGIEANKVHYAGSSMSVGAVILAVASLLGDATAQMPAPTPTSPAPVESYVSPDNSAALDTAAELDRKVMRLAAKKIVTAATAAAKRTKEVITEKDLRSVVEAVFFGLSNEVQELVAEELRWEIQPYRLIADEYARNIMVMKTDELPRFLVFCALAPELNCSPVSHRSGIWRGFENRYIDMAVVRRELTDPREEKVAAGKKAKAERVAKAKAKTPKEKATAAVKRSVAKGKAAAKKSAVLPKAKVAAKAKKAGRR